MKTYRQQLALVNSLLNKINAEENAIKADCKAGKISREQAEEQIELPAMWLEYREQLAVLNSMDRPVESCEGDE